MEKKLKLPFCVKTQDGALGCRFSKEEIMSYILSIVYHNASSFVDIDRLKMGYYYSHPPEIEQFLKTFQLNVAIQLNLNYAFRNLEAVALLHQLRDRAPAAFLERFNSIEVKYKSSQISLEKIRGNFTDHEALIFKHHKMSDGSSILDRYYWIRDNANLDCLTIIEEIRSQYLIEWARVNKIDTALALKVLEYIEAGYNKYLTRLVNAYHYDEKKNPIQQYNESYHQSVLERGENLITKKINMWENPKYRLTINADLSELVYEKIKEFFPSTYTQIERLRLNSLYELKNIEKISSSGKKNKI